jgi:tetratricopeptide (TPR) repeat protein
MGHYWYDHGQSLVGSSWLQRALAQAPAASPATRGLALLALGIMSAQRQEADDATKLLIEARELYGRVQDRGGEARCLVGAGIVADSAGRTAEARDYLRAAVALFNELGDSAGRTDALVNLGVVHLHEGDWQAARDVFEANLPRYRAIGNVWSAGCTALDLGLAYVLGGRSDDARSPIREAFDVFTDWQDPNGLAETLEATVGLAVIEERWTLAARLAGAVHTARETLGVRGEPPDLARFEGWVDRIAKQLGPDDFEAAMHEGGAMTEEQATAYALKEIVG